MDEFNFIVVKKKIVMVTIVDASFLHNFAKHLDNCLKE